jgi:hypothetical protein
VNWREFVYLVALIGTLIWARFINRQSTTQEDHKILDAAGIGAIYATIVSVFVLPHNSIADGSFLVFFSAVPATVLGTWMLRKGSTSNEEVPRFMSYVSFVLIIMCTGTLLARYVTYHQIQNENESHKKFEWNFAGLSATSRVDPAEMNRSVSLISKYQPKGPLLIISKYDNWFRILSNRPDYYIPIDWRSAVASHEIVNQTAVEIIQSNTPVVFVENQLMASMGGNERSDTTESLLAMKQLTLKISQCYTPGEVGGLLQVWHRSCETN